MFSLTQEHSTIKKMTPFTSSMFIHFDPAHTCSFIPIEPKHQNHPMFMQSYSETGMLSPSRRYHSLPNGEGGSAGGRSVAITTGECSTRGGDGYGDGGTGSGPGGMAGADTCRTSGGAGSVREIACKVAPPPAVCVGATRSVRDDAHVTSGETVDTASRGRTSPLSSSVVREVKLSTPTPFNSIASGGREQSS